MANVGFKMGLQTALDDLLKAGVGANATPGTFYLTSDTNRLYIGKDDKSIAPVNAGIITVENTNSLPSTTGLSAEQKKKLAGNYYYAAEQNILCVFNGSNWVQINSVVTNDRMTQSTSATTGGTTLRTALYDSTGGDPVSASFSVVGEDGITVSGDGSTITVKGDPISITTANDATNNTATATVKSASGSTDTSFSVKGGTNVQVSSAGNVITVSATDKYTDHLEVTNRNEGFGIASVDNEGTTSTAAVLNPVIALDGSIKSDDASFKFVNGTATLPVYTAKEVDGIKAGLESKLATELKAFNAMEYKGTVGTEGDIKALPAVGDLVKSGYAYLVSGSLTVGTTTYPAGTLVVASGTEDAATGYLTAIEWSYVTGSTADTTYHGEIASNGALQLVPSTAGDPVATINVAQGNDIVVSTSGAVGGKSQTYTVAHKAYEGTSYDTTGATAATAMNPKATYEIPVISGITVSNGHITGVTATKYTVRDTNVTIGSTTARVSAVGNVATVSHKLVLKDGEGSDVVAPADAEFAISSSSLEVTASNNNNVAINLVWGSF